MKKRNLLTLILSVALLGVNLNVNAMRRGQPDNPSRQSGRQEKRPRRERPAAQPVLTERSIQKLQILDQQFRVFLHDLEDLSRHGNDDIRNLLAVNVDIVREGSGILAGIINKTNDHPLTDFLHQSNDRFSSIEDALNKAYHVGANPGVINPLLEKAENIKRLVAEIIIIQNSAPIIEDLNEEQASRAQRNAPPQPAAPMQQDGDDSEDEAILRKQEAARGSQVEEFNLLMERLKVAIDKLSESRLEADFQNVTLALGVVKTNPEYVRRKTSLRHVDLEKVRKGEEKDLSFADLKNLDLTRFDLSGAVLIGANLNGANLSEANLENSIICDTDLSSATLNATQLKNAKIINSNFSKSTINEVRTDHVLILNQTKFEHAKLINSKFKDSLIKNANFMNATLNNFTFDTSTIENTNMRNIKAEGISFISTPLKMVSFVLAQIKGLYFFGTGILGNQLSFKYASINKGVVLGGHSASTKVTSDEVVDYYLNDKRDFNTFKTEIIKYDLAGTVVESMFLNIDFHGVKMKDVYFSQILFPSISNISESKIFIGCIFNNIVAKLNIINVFFAKGAQITTPWPSTSSISYIESSNYESKRSSVEYDISNTHSSDELFVSINEWRQSSAESEHSSNESKITDLRIEYLRCNHSHCSDFDFIWKKTEYESYMQQAIKAIISGAIGGLFQIKL